MRASRFKKPTEDTQVPHGHQQTSFGIPVMEREDGSFLIDMTAMRVFSGIPGFVGFLAKQVLEQCRRSSVDILTQVMVDSENTPDLTGFNITHVLTYARGPVARKVLQNPDGFIGHLRLVFDALQTPRWGGLLFPMAFPQENQAVCDAPAQEIPALLFPFHTGCEEESSYFMLLEYDRDGRFLRITVEDSMQSRLFLKRIPHRVVHEAGRRHYRQDVAIMAQQIFTGIHRECQNQHNEYMEIPGRQPAFFELLIDAGLENVTGAVFRWTQETSEKLLLNPDSDFSLLLSKVLLLLEDEGLVRILSAGNTLEMMDAHDRVYMDLSRKGVMLNISIGEPRKQPDMHAHLLRMPRLLNTQQAADANLLEKFRIVLIHHATSEVLGFVKALEAAGCGFLTTLFIRYQGIVPDFHLEDMLSMPDQRFRFCALQRIELRDSVDGAYILSRRYSSLEDLNGLDHALRRLRGNYLDSMRLAAGNLFFREAMIAQREGRELLLIEDGGYLAPILNRICHESRTLAHALAVFETEAPPTMETAIPLALWLRNLLPATFEHTANGYYHLRDIQEAFGGLFFPTFTIATSRYKNVVEAEACAHSIFNAVESIFNGLGKCMMHRHALVLGSRGNIGHFLFKTLHSRTSYGKTLGLDIRAPFEEGPSGREFSSIEQVPKEEWKNLDLFLGVTGISVLKREFFERLILEGTAQAIFFASGSTKTIEFAHLTDWIETLCNTPHPHIGGLPVRLEKRAVKDPQNLVLQGHHIQIIFEGTRPSAWTFAGNCKDLYLLGDAMPINFLYYGVPGEVIDGVFEELYSLLCGFVSRRKAGESYLPDMYAVDVNIDKTAGLFQTGSKK